MLEKAEGTKTGELTEDKGDSIQISESEEKDTNISQEKVKDSQKTGSNKKAVQSRKAEKTDKKPKSCEKGKEPAKESMAELIKAFNKMEARYNDMEKMMNRKFVDLESVFQSKIDRFENQVLRKLTGVVNTAVSTLKEGLGEEIDDL